MIPMTDKQSADLTTELVRVEELAHQAFTAKDAGSIRKALLATRMATMNAMSVLNDIEAGIRTKQTEVA